MSPRVVLHVRAGLMMLSVLSVLAFSSRFLTAQVTVSAGPLPLYEVKTIYIGPSSDDFVRLLKSRLEKWGAVNVTGKPKKPMQF
jgi:hypothetical protein